MLILIITSYCISPWFTVEINCEDDTPMERKAVISAGLWDRCIELSDKIDDTGAHCKKWDRTSLLDNNWTDWEREGCYDNFFKATLKSFNRNSLWNAAAMMLFVGNTFILLPSVTVLLIPTQQKFSSDIAVLTHEKSKLVVENFSISFPAYLALLGILAIYIVIFTSFLRFYHFPYPYTEENRKKLDKIISEYQILGTKKWDEYNKRQKNREEDLLQELEVDAISENSREDFSSIGTKSPMPSIGRVSGFSTLEAVSEMDEKNDNFEDFN
ncbi:Oidioi.mRNA.OKI2018_I69.chr2.g7947.t1.cds [Oikopleura dioica]|uniref:Oidioi.mRNA.OKI2018_I69.chr2.g7947.t1.cds n=1 Tax=Oikopleura dioica TaxID=34765 RepID=A0ABN7TEE0_OIKDI|nr:Oidioi.mRNA.OKI2018_I69.chr2.g7947.t1.cds [Oikopleura dioica]